MPVIVMLSVGFICWMNWVWGRYEVKQDLIEACRLRYNVHQCLVVALPTEKAEAVLAELKAKESQPK